MKYDEYKEKTKTFEKSGILDSATEMFGEAITKKISKLDNDALYKKETLVELLTYTFREAYRTAHRTNLLENLDDSELYQALEENEKELKHLE